MNLFRTKLRGTSITGTGLDGLRWSDPATWGGSLPQAGDAVTIPVDTTIIWDVASTPNLGKLQIDGNLIVDPAVLAVSLTVTDYAVGSTGFWKIAGTGNDETADFYEGTATINVNGARNTHTSRASFDGATQGFTNAADGRSGLTFGRRLWKARHKNIPKTKLANTAASGATSIYVLGNCTDWAIGDDIVIAPTNFWGQSISERRTLTSVGTYDGTKTQVGFTTPLTEKHWGVLQYPIDATYGTESMSLTPGTFTAPSVSVPTVFDARAEVLNISSGRIIVQAPNDSAWSTQGWGVHTMDMFGSMHYERGVRIIRGGQRGALGRYPFHTHKQSYADRTGTVTMANSSGDLLVTWTGHQIPLGTTQPVMFGTNGTLPSGLAVGSVTVSTALVTGSKYWTVPGSVTANTFKLSSAPGGAAISWSGSSTGTHTCQYTYFVSLAANKREFCVVDTSENRAFTTHASCGNILQDCIAYDIKGQANFLEDGSEVQNTLKRIFVLKVRNPSSGNKLKAFDGVSNTSGQYEFFQSSGHWLSNMDNHMEELQAADCEGGAVHNTLGDQCFGLSALVAIQPNLVGVRRWLKNGGHSNQMRGVFTVAGVSDEFGSGNAPTFRPSGNAGVAGFPDNLMEGGITWKNNQGGYSNSVDGPLGPLYIGWTAADNAGGDFEGVTSAGLSHSHLFIAQSLNDGFLAPIVSLFDGTTVAPRFGAATYHFTLIFKNCAFQNYQWIRGKYKRGGQQDYGGGAMAWRDLYTLSIGAWARVSTGHKLNNSNMGFVSRSPRYAGYPCTLSLANPCVLNGATEGVFFENNEPVIFPRTSGVLPSPFVVDTIYYAKNCRNVAGGSLLSNGVVGFACELSLTPGGASISTAASSQSGIHEAMPLWRGTNTWINFDVMGGALDDTNRYYGNGSTGTTPRYVVQNQPFLAYDAQNTFYADPENRTVSTTDGYVGIADFYNSSAPYSYPTIMDMKIERMASQSSETIVGTAQIGQGVVSGVSGFFIGKDHLAVNERNTRYKITHPSYAPPTNYAYYRIADGMRSTANILFEVPWSGSVTPSQVARMHNFGPQFPPSYNISEHVSDGSAIVCTPASGADRAAKIAAVAASANGSLYYQDTTANSIFMKHVPMPNYPGSSTDYGNLPESNQEKWEVSQYLKIIS